MAEIHLPEARLEKPSLFYPGRKPVGPLAIDWSHPMTHRLKRAYVPQLHSTAATTAYLWTQDIVTGRNRQGGAVSLNFGLSSGGDGSMGPVLTSHATNGHGKVAPFGPMPDAGTVFSYFRLGTISLNYIVGLCHADHTAGHRIYNGTGGSTTAWSVRLGSIASQSYTVPVYASGEIHSQAVTWVNSATKAAAYFDGANKLDFDRGASDPASSASYSAIGYSNGTATCRHDFICGYVWDRALNANEIASLHHNRYQFLVPA